MPVIINLPIFFEWEVAHNASVYEGMMSVNDGGRGGDDDGGGDDDNDGGDDDDDDYDDYDGKGQR